MLLLSLMAFVRGVVYTEFKECNTSNDFLCFFDNDELSFRHTYYYHYTSINNVSKILNSKQIRLTRLSTSANDLLEKEHYAKFGNNIFSLCFSTGTSESLPLWYLYSGIDGCGARIGLKRRSFSQLINSPTFLLIEVESKYPYNAIGEPLVLRPKDYMCQCRDILYIGQDPQNNDIFRAKYNGQVKNGLPKDTANSLKKEYARFTKGLIWFYEKETRLQVEITNKEILDSEKAYAVGLKLDDIYDEMSVRLAPEYGEIQPNLFDNYAGIKNWAYAKLQKSAYAGQLKMGIKEKLCSECKENKKQA